MRARLTTIAAACLAFQALSFDNQALRRGMAAFRQRDFHTAEREFKVAVQTEPGSARIWKLLGMTYIAQEKYEAAEDPCRRACALDPHEENACYYSGRVDFTLGRFPVALQAYETALANRVDAGRALLGIALTYQAMSKPGDAERNYKLAISAGEARAKVDYGLFLFKQGRGEESLAVLRRAGAKEELSRVEKALREAGPAAGEPGHASSVRFDPSPLGMVVNNGATGAKHLIETMIAGVAVFDYDGDGWPDIFIANGAAVPSLEKIGPQFFNRLFRNNRDGTFTDVTQKAGVAGSGYSMGVAAADYDNDGHVDLFVTGVRGNTLYRNRGDGTFEDVTKQAGLGGKSQWAVAAGWFDYDNDGRLDLFVVRYVQWNPVTETACGFPEKGIRQYCNPKLYAPLANVLYHNEGHGRFRDVSQESGIAAHPGKGMGVAFGSVNGGRRPDIFVANDTMRNFLFHNRGDGTFAEVSTKTGVAYNDDGVALSSMGVDFRDYDNDGKDDVFITALSNETFPLFRNLGGHFGDVTYPAGIGKTSFPWSGWSCGMFDLNNDGYKDVFTANGHVMDNEELTSSRRSRQPNAIFVNRGNGTFRTQLLPGAAMHRGAAFGDFNRDGRIDVVVTRLNESPLILWNVSEGTGHWVTLRLEGVRSNRDGLGTRVHLISPAGEQWNQATTSVGYGGSSDRLVHFGLGTDTRVRSIEIEWPSGIRQVLRDVAVDRYY
ncbi:MAG: FG-GAP-like repeat-containing protein, partial [Bryobacteraceae bacterium]